MEYEANTIVDNTVITYSMDIYACLCVCMHLLNNINITKPASYTPLHAYVHYKSLSSNNHFTNSYLHEVSITPELKLN